MPHLTAEKIKTTLTCMRRDFVIVLDFFIQNCLQQVAAIMCGINVSVVIYCK